jgi:hypothetical protein
MTTGETEFGGVGGLVAPQTYSTGTENVQQQMWEVYATNAAPDSVAADSDPKQQAPLGRVGKKPPRESYTPNPYQDGGL